MSNEDKKVCKIEDERLTGYTQRTRNGSDQVFYTGTDSRDFERYRAEGGNTKPGITMHDKPDTIHLAPPERHYYAKLFDGEWWWVNGCAECNGRPRDWMTYIECEDHDVCRTCSSNRSQITETPWAGKHGWQCVPCANSEREALKEERLQAVANKEYDEWDFYHCDKVTCPHCATAYQPDEPPSDGRENCEVCGGEFSLEVEYSVSYTTRVTGERVTA